ncbi:hypothetical protein O181_034328 [Austropuccinia psidii MF-1]|uniref:Uncharacterized protein n=1 Tax=Austropuccinia psidii MF-1 TaxID=1389203 RepID=A0A9Q3D387_9BASI|nr:hypothetical protein [Austropuccinia psidii MF-1]
MAQTLPTRVKNPQIEAFSSGQCVQYGRNSYGVCSQGTMKDEPDLSTQIMDGAECIKSIIDVKFNNFDKELKKLTSNINQLRNNDRTSTEWCKVINERLESIPNTCDGIENKCEVQNVHLDSISTNNINDHITILKDHVLDIAHRKNLFDTHF